MSTNRREFLKGSGGLVLAGLAGASGLASAAAAAPSPASHGGSIERWLLETGRDKLDDGLYRAVAGGKI
ncbi:MAG TPA: hypothetical protein VFR03_07525 [Thermoanaerobaculia bacterium]|nr:hypothetical protein [Thermoanaerobaculia bacterium]